MAQQLRIRALDANIIFKYLKGELLLVCLIGGVFGWFAVRTLGVQSMVLESTYNQQMTQGRDYVESRYLHDLVVLRPDGRFLDIYDALTGGDPGLSVILRIRGKGEISVSGVESEQIPATDSTARPTRPTWGGSVLNGDVRAYLLPTDDDIRWVGEHCSLSKIGNLKYLEGFARVWQSERVNRSDHTFHDLVRLGFDASARISFLSYVFENHVTVDLFFDSVVVFHLHLSKDQDIISVSGNPEDVRFKIMEAAYAKDSDGVLTSKCLQSFNFKQI